MPKNPPEEPGFQIPLSDDQLRELGRFTAAWSQIDFMLSQIIKGTISMKPGIAGIFVDDLTTGGLVNLLRKLIPQLPNDKAKSQAETFCARMTKLVERRNHIMHGIWGARWNFENDTLKAACHFQKNAGKPIYAKELRMIADAAAKESRNVLELGRSVAPWFPKKINQPFVFGKGNPPNRLPPDWYK